MNAFYIIFGLIVLGLGLFNIWTFVETCIPRVRDQILEHLEEEHPDYDKNALKKIYNTSKWSFLVIGVLLVGLFALIITGIHTGHLH